MTTYRFVMSLLRPIMRACFRLDVSPGAFEGPAVVVANHASNLDPVLLAMALEPQLAFMAKAEMFRIPLLAPILRAGGVFPVMRGRGGRLAIDAAIAQAKAGRPIAMFPEGTRSRNGDLGKAKAGAALIALEAGVPIIPVAIAGTFEAMPRGRFFPRLGRPLSVKIGQSIDSSVFQGDPEGVARLTDQYMRALQELLREGTE